MTRKSFQRITLSIELTLPPGGKPADQPKLIRAALANFGPASSYDLNLAIIKIIKRETIYP